MDIFTSREIAIIFWIVIFFVALLFIKQIRTSILGIIKSAPYSVLLAYFLLFLIYFSSFIYCFYDLGWWDLSNLKDTIIWFVFSGLPIGFSVAQNTFDNSFWKSLVLKNIKLVVLVEFLIDTFTFPLIVEIIMIPIVTVIALLNTVCKQNEESKGVETLTNAILSIMGLFILSYTICRAITEYNSIGTISTLQYFLFPIIYSILSIPCMYILKLYTEYETLFNRLKYGQKRSKKLDLLIKLRLLKFCNFRLKRLQIAKNSNNYNIRSISSKDEIEKMIQSYKNALSQDMSLKRE